MDDAVATLRKRAAALQSGAGSVSPEVGAAIKDAVADFEAVASRLKAQVAAGKLEANKAVDAIAKELEAAGARLQKLAAKGQMDKAVGDLAGAARARGAARAPWLGCSQDAPGLLSSAPLSSAP